MRSTERGSAERSPSKPHAEVSDIVDYSRASVALPEPPSKSGKYTQLSLWNSTPMLNYSYALTSQVSPSTQTFETTTPLQDSLTSLPLDSLAQEPAARGNGTDSLTQTQPCGEKDSDVFVSPDPDLSLWNNSHGFINRGLRAVLGGLGMAGYQTEVELISLLGRRSAAPTQPGLYCCLRQPPTRLGSGNYRPAGSNKLEQSLKPFLGQGDKLNPAAVGWMMGYPPGWVEGILMDGGLSIQLPFITEYVTIPTTAAPAATSTVNPSLPNKQRSPLEESSTSTASPETFFHKKENREDFLMENTPTVPPQKEAENFLMENTPTFFHKKGRGKQKIPPSGSLVPVVQKKRDKQGRVVEYPKVEGDRVSRDLAFDYPHQFIWLYCWAVENDGRWQKKSKSVPRNRIGLVKAAIASNKPVEEILQLIKE